MLEIYSAAVELMYSRKPNVFACSLSFTVSSNGLDEQFDSQVNREIGAYRHFLSHFWILIFHTLLPNEVILVWKKL